MLREGQRRIPGSKKRTVDLRQFKTTAVAEEGGVAQWSFRDHRYRPRLAQEEGTLHVPNPTSGGGGASPSLSLAIHPAETISRRSRNEMSQLDLLLRESIFPLL